MPRQTSSSRHAPRSLSSRAHFIEIATRCALVDAGKRRGVGKVTLVGAGPGDPDLLTVKAVRVIQSADVILFDDLVSDEVLELARATAQKILVGKRGGRLSCRQEDINSAMLLLAKKGLHVVRLKSGDPMIFGRAGEEIAVLQQEQIDVEVVPGITASLGAAAQLKVSLTHRDHAQGVKFITAHSKQGELPVVDWGACADEKTTLVFYMGGRTAPQAADRLIEEGLARDTPVVLMWAVSRPNERHRTMSLEDLSRTTIPTVDPVIVGIGRVFGALSKKAQIWEGAKTDNAKSSEDLEKPLDIALQ